MLLNQPNCSAVCQPLMQLGAAAISAQVGQTCRYTQPLCMHLCIIHGLGQLPAPDVLAG
jgi:hypothetical protein